MRGKFKIKHIISIIMVMLLICGLSVAASACQENTPMEYDKSTQEKIPMEYDKSTKYGIYWIGEDNGDYVRSDENMDKKYFDPSKPTFVFAHGWEPDKNNSTDGLFEDFVTHKETVAKTGTSEVRDYAEILKEQGYNVALMSWFSYASNLTALFKSIWLSFDGGYALSTRFAMELASVLGEGYKGEVKMVGHSYGSQLALATTYQLIDFQNKGMFDNDNIIPTRLTLADPYFGESGLIANWKNICNSNLSFTEEPLQERRPATLFADVLDGVVSKKNIAVDLYFGMGMASTYYYKYDGSDASFEKLSKNCVIVNCDGLRKKYGDFSIHNVTRDWVLSSIVDKILFRDQNGDVAPSGATSDKEIKSLRGKCYNQTLRDYDVKNDSVIIVDRLAGEFL